MRDYQQIKLKGETAGQLGKRTLAYDTGFTLAPGTYTLKFMPRENETGKMGTFETKFVVPDLTTSCCRFRAWFEQPAAGHEHGAGDRGEGQEAAGRQPSGAGQPEAGAERDAVIKKDQDMFVFLEAISPTPAPRNRSLPRSVSYRGKVKAFETDPLQVTDGRHQWALPVRFSVPLSKLAPGRYTCR